MRELTRQQARRVAVRAQLLDAPRPTDLLHVVRRLTLLQVDLTAHVAPSAELVLWSRLGSAADSSRSLEEACTDRTLVELEGRLRPAEDVALHRAEMTLRRTPDHPHAFRRELHTWVEVNHVCRDDVLEALRLEGPLPARELPDTCVVPWRSSGWTAGRNTVRMLDALEARGEVAVSHRERRERVWDLAERVWGDDPRAAPAPAEAGRELARRRLASLGIERSRAHRDRGVAEGDEVGVPARVEGLRGTWRVDPEQLARIEEPFAGRCALLSPLDQLVFDRRRTSEVFGFDYQLEMYKPAAQRRWGYWALPVLHGDRLVARLDVAADRAGGALRVQALHPDEPLAPDVLADVWAEVDDLARHLDLVAVDETT